MLLKISIIWFFFVYLYVPLITCFVPLSELLINRRDTLIYEMDRIHLYSCIRDAEILSILGFISLCLGGFIFTFLSKKKFYKKDNNKKKLIFFNINIALRAQITFVFAELLYKITKLFFLNKDQFLKTSGVLLSEYNVNLGFIFSPTDFVKISSAILGSLIGLYLVKKFSRNKLKELIIFPLFGTYYSLFFYFSSLIIFIDLINSFSLTAFGIFFGSILLSLITTITYLNKFYLKKTIFKLIFVVAILLSVIFYSIRLNDTTSWIYLFRVNQSYVVQRVVEFKDRLSGGSFGNLLRQLNETKKIEGIDGNITGQQLDVINKYDDKSGIAITLVGDTFLSGGYIFTIVTFFLIGLFIKLLEISIFDKLGLDILSLSLINFVFLNLLSTFESPFNVFFSVNIFNIILSMIIYKFSKSLIMKITF